MKILAPILFLFLTACGIQAQLQRAFVGKDLKFIEKTLNMKASRIQKLEAGKTKAIFIREEKLKATPINQGGGTLDPIVSPMVNKTEYFIFIFNEQGNTIKTEYQKEYERK